MSCSCPLLLITSSWSSRSSTLLAQDLQLATRARQVLAIGFRHFHCWKQINAHQHVIIEMCLCEKANPGRSESLFCTRLRHLQRHLLSSYSIITHRLQSCKSLISRSR
ncbi:hypothetical protein BJ912DRAFT_981698 [Pholiota molesta]|nr:hypothetical protein BJ912DRAFT_981698 [Pholiota molesta]